MKILVAGGLGFIGSNFVRYIVSKHPECRITNLDKVGLGSNPESLKDIEESGNYQFVKGDISDSEVVNRLVKDVDAIVNFAAETHVDRSIADPEPFLRSNTIGTFTLLESARKHNETVNHVQISTDETYGEILEGSSSELDMLRPSNPYSATKASADMLCIAYHRTYGSDVKITRCTNNFGPYQFPEKLIPKTIIRAFMNVAIPVYGSGTNVRDWIYVLDHCDAVFRVLNQGRPGEIYNISSNNELSNIKVVKQILSFLEKSEELIRFVEDRPGHDVRYSLGSSKIRSELGWKPEHDFLEALAETVSWYVKNEWWWRPLLKDEFVQSDTPWLK